MVCVNFYNHTGVPNTINDWQFISGLGQSELDTSLLQRLFILYELGSSLYLYTGPLWLASSSQRIGKTKKKKNHVSDHTSVLRTTGAVWDRERTLFRSFINRSRRTHGPWEDSRTSSIRHRGTDRNSSSVTATMGVPQWWDTSYLLGTRGDFRRVALLKCRVRGPRILSRPLLSSRGPRVITDTQRDHERDDLRGGGVKRREGSR